MTPGPTYVTLSESSDFYAAAALQNANASFVDGLGNRLAIAPQSAGDTYQFGGGIYNFQSGDTIAFQETSGSPTPTGFSYSNGVLKILGASNVVLGTLDVSGNFGALGGAQEGSSSLSALSPGRYRRI